MFYCNFNALNGRFCLIVVMYSSLNIHLYNFYNIILNFRSKFGPIRNLNANVFTRNKNSNAISTEIYLCSLPQENKQNAIVYQD